MIRRKHVFDNFSFFFYRKIRFYYCQVEFTSRSMNTINISSLFLFISYTLSTSKSFAACMTEKCQNLRWYDDKNASYSFFVFFCYFKNTHLSSFLIEIVDFDVRRMHIYNKLMFILYRSTIVIFFTVRRTFIRIL